MALSSRVWGAGKILVLLAGLTATFLISAFLSIRFAVRAREIVVPSLVGRSVNDASVMLEEIGLTLRVDDNRRADEKVPAGHVLLQDPPVLRSFEDESPPGFVPISGVRGSCGIRHAGKSRKFGLPYLF